MHTRRHHRHEHDDDDDEDAPSWQGFFRCDDLIPPMCDDRMQVTTGTVRTRNGIEIAYWRYTPDELEPHKFPIVVVNGGPGLPHNFVKPTRNLACDGREVVLYDQAGTGASQLEHQQNEGFDAADEVPELLTLHYYARVELPALLDELQWPRYHILAESWGTQIALEFATHDKLATEGLQSLILNAPIADNHKFVEYQWDPVDGTVGGMPTVLQNRLQYFNQTQDFDNPEFQQLEDSVVANFNARIGVEVDCWIETEQAGISNIDYTALTGASDIFYAPDDADLHGWTVLPQLYKLQDRIAVQLNHGGFDMVRPRLISDTAAAIGGQAVECHLLPQAAHSILLDSPAEVMLYMQGFLTRVEYAHHNRIPFVANGTCPVWNNHPGHGMQGMWKLANSSAATLVEVVLTLILATTLSFWLGLKIGTRRNKGFMGGYEQLAHHHEHPIGSVVLSRTNTIEME